MNKSWVVMYLENESRTQLNISSVITTERERMNPCNTHALPTAGRGDGEVKNERHCSWKRWKYWIVCERGQGLDILRLITSRVLEIKCEVCHYLFVSIFKHSIYIRQHGSIVCYLLPLSVSDLNPRACISTKRGGVWFHKLQYNRTRPYESNFPRTTQWHQ